MEKSKKIDNKTPKYHKLSNFKFDNYFLSFLADGKSYRVDLRKQSLKLANSDLRVKNNFKISPSGYGIHWDDIDEDLSINGLIKSAEKSNLYKIPKIQKFVLKDKKVKKKNSF